jgi:hypothetical protein
VVASYLAIVSEWARQGGKLDLARVVKQALDITLNGMAEERRVARAERARPRRHERAPAPTRDRAGGDATPLSARGLGARVPVDLCGVDQRGRRHLEVARVVDSLRPTT